MLTHWKRLWCWEGLGAGGKGDDRGWDGWMASLTWWTWVWVNCGSWCWTGRPGVLRFMGSQRVGHNWETELYWTEWLHFNTTIVLKTLFVTTVAFWSTLSYAFNMHLLRGHNLAPNRQKSKVSLLLSQCRRFQCTDWYAMHIVCREFLRCKGELPWGV